MIMGRCKKYNTEEERKAADAERKRVSRASLSPKKKRKAAAKAKEYIQLLRASFSPNRKEEEAAKDKDRKEKM